MKECNICLEFKDESEFHFDKRRKQSHPRCKECAKLIYRERMKEPAYREAKKKTASKRRAKKASKEYNRWHNIKNKYGLTEEQYMKMYEAQNGLCKICNKPNEANSTTYLVVDHCHDTGDVRGLLCSQCNSGIGLLQDDYKLVAKAAEYLKDSHEKR